MFEKKFDALTQRDDFLFTQLMKLPETLLPLLNQLLGVQNSHILCLPPAKNPYHSYKMIRARLLDDEGNKTATCMVACAQPDDDLSGLMTACESFLIAREITLDTLDEMDTLRTVIIAAADSERADRACTEIKQAIYANGAFLGYCDNLPSSLLLYPHYRECNVSEDVAAFLDFMAGRETRNRYACYLAELTEWLKCSPELAERYNRLREELERGQQP